MCFANAKLSGCRCPVDLVGATFPPRGSPTPGWRIKADLGTDDAATLALRSSQTAVSHPLVSTELIHPAVLVSGLKTFLTSGTKQAEVSPRFECVFFWLQVLFLLRSYQTDSHRPLTEGNGISEALHQHMWLASQ